MPDGQRVIVREVDERMLFPSGLAGMKPPPEKLAVDAIGRVWAPVLSGGNSGHIIVRYDPETGATETFGLPEHSGTNFSSEIGVGPGGEVVVAYGSLVVVVDPETGSPVAHALPEDSPNFASFGDEGGTYVTGMSVSASGLAYITRMNVAAVTVLDLVTGAVTEIPVDGASGPLFAVDVAGEHIYAVNWVRDTPTGGTRVIRIDLDGTQRVIEGSAWALAGAGDRMYSLGLGGELREYAAGARTAQEKTQVLQAPIDGTIAVDPRNGGVWASGRESGVVTRWDPANEAATTYDLPVYLVPHPRCPSIVDCEVVHSHAIVGGLAVAPSGDVYFTDVSMGRIGVIPASHQ